MDAQLIERVKQHNDHRAFEQLVKLYQSPIRQFLRKLLQQNDDLAEELAQETFLKAFVHIDKYQHEGKFLSWLFKIAYQQFVNAYRKQKNFKYSDAEQDSAAIDVEPQLIAERTVKSLLVYLKPQERALILLHYSNGLSHQEIAEVMDLPLGTVKSLIRRSKLRLQSLLTVEE